MDEGVNIHLIYYDQLLRQPKAVFGEALQWMGIPYTEKIVDHADSNMQFGKLQATEAKTLGGRVPFFRRGSDGSGSLELKPETVAKIHDATKDQFARANELLARQSARRKGIGGSFAAAAQARGGDGKVIPTSKAR